MDDEKSTIVVSVIMITYGHASYIKQAINGVLMQKVNCVIEFIIANDNSPDNSDEVIKEATSNLPENIKVNYINREKNIGPNANFLDALTRSSGKYIAICEGDDYWVDPLKLQMQVDFLEANNDTIMVYTNRLVDYNGDVRNDVLVPIDRNKTLFSIEDMPVFAPTLTRVFRNDIRVLDDMKKAKVGGGDSFLMISQSKYGKIKFIDKVTAVYRVHNEGVWSSLNAALRVEFKVLTFLNCLLIVDNPVLIKKLRNKIIYDMIYLIKDENAVYFSKLAEYLRENSSSFTKGLILRLNLLNYIIGSKFKLIFSTEFMNKGLRFALRYK